MANKKLIWNVYRYNLNKRKIEVFNIFEHNSFAESVRVNLKRHNSKDEFAKVLRLDLQYYFWSKSEYEVLISPWAGSQNKEAETIKIDIYNQVMNNFDIFCDYIWNSEKRKLNDATETETLNKTGVWKYKHYGNGSNECSICGRSVGTNDEDGYEQSFKFCPYCGTEMVNTIEKANL